MRHNCALLSITVSVLWTMTHTQANSAQIDLQCRTVVVDIDRDGDDDLLRYVPGEPGQVLLNSGALSFSEMPLPDEVDTLRINDIALIQIDGDEWKEVLLVSDSGSLVIETGAELQIRSRIAGGFDAQLHDLDADGQPELLIGSSVYAVQSGNLRLLELPPVRGVRSAGAGGKMTISGEQDLKGSQQQGTSKDWTGTANGADTPCTSPECLSMADQRYLNAADEEVGEANIIDGAVTGSKIAPNSVSSVHLVDGAVSSIDLATGAVGGAQIQDHSVTSDKLELGLTVPNSDHLDWLDSSQFLRSDISDTLTGNLTVLDTLRVGTGHGTAVTPSATVVFGDPKGSDYMFSGHAFTLQGIFSDAQADKFPYIQMLDEDSSRAFFLGWGSKSSHYIDWKFENGYDLSIQGANVGIGTTSPAARLNVVGNGILADRFAVQNINDRANDSPWYGLGQSNYILPGTFIDSPAVQLAGFYGLLLKTEQGELAIHEFGNVGVGTTDPQDKLHVIGNVRSGTVSGGNGAFYLGNPSHGLRREQNNDVDLYTAGSASLRFLIDESEKARITAAGNLGIGTTAPTARLETRTDHGHGVVAITSGASDEVAGIYGENTATTANTKGVTGITHSPGAPTGSSIGVYGVSASSSVSGGGSFGVMGRSNQFADNVPTGSAAVMGYAPGNTDGSGEHNGGAHGGWFETNSRIDGLTGITGRTTAQNGKVTGVYGATRSTHSGAAGVVGDLPYGGQTGKAVWGRVSLNSGIAVYASTTPTQVGVYSEGRMAAKAYDIVAEIDNQPRSLHVPQTAQQVTVLYGHSNLSEERAQIQAPRWLVEVASHNGLAMQIYLTPIGPGGVYVESADESTGSFVIAGKARAVNYMLVASSPATDEPKVSEDALRHDVGYGGVQPPTFWDGDHVASDFHALE